MRNFEKFTVQLENAIAENNLSLAIIASHNEGFHTYWLQSTCEHKFTCANITHHSGDIWLAFLTHTFTSDKAGEMQAYIAFQMQCTQLFQVLIAK